MKVNSKKKPELIEVYPIYGKSKLGEVYEVKTEELIREFNKIVNLRKAEVEARIKLDDDKFKFRANVKEEKCHIKFDGMPCSFNGYKWENCQKCGKPEYMHLL